LHEKKGKAVKRKAFIDPKHKRTILRQVEKRFKASSRKKKPKGLPFRRKKGRKHHQEKKVEKGTNSESRNSGTQSTWVVNTNTAKTTAQEAERPSEKKRISNAPLRERTPGIKKEESRLKTKETAGRVASMQNTTESIAGQREDSRQPRTEGFWGKKKKRERRSQYRHSMQNHTKEQKVTSRRSKVPELDATRQSITTGEETKKKWGGALPETRGETL